MTDHAPQQNPSGQTSRLQPALAGIGSLWRTTTVRLTALFIAIFVGFAIVLLGFLAYQTSTQIQRQQVHAIEREVAQIQLLAQEANVRTVAFAIQRLADRPGPGIYYLGDLNGNMLAGNVANLPAAVMLESGRYELSYERGLEIYGEPEDGATTTGTAIVQSLTLINGLRLIIGRDIGEQRSFTGIVFTTFLWGAVAIVLLSVVAGGITARYVLRRIDGITGTSAKIMSGDLSERIPVTGSNDEFDSMATHLNAMLDRIEQLMSGLKEVTDNVAHDLKTPLTRLRNKAEAALRNDNPDARREALETTIAESDQLIRTFNALLLIARAEAGAPSGAFSETDISEVVTDVADLYGPVAEDAGIALTVNVTDGMTMQASRELIGQALVNLVENAIKYGAENKDGGGMISLSAHREAGDIVITVADNGPGIPEADRKRVFERFARLETSRTEPGAGLGLSLVSAVVRLHGGSVHFEDNAPGARAVIRFP